MKTQGSENTQSNKDERSEKGGGDRETSWFTVLHCTATVGGEDNAGLAT
jgi:hypothetical protein